MQARKRTASMYVAYWNQAAHLRIIAVPEGSSTEDIVPDRRPVLGTYGTRGEAQQAIDEERERFRLQWV